MSSGYECLMCVLLFYKEWFVNGPSLTSWWRFAFRGEDDKTEALVVFTMESDVERLLVFETRELNARVPRRAIHEGQSSAPDILRSIYRGKDNTE